MKDTADATNRDLAILAALALFVGVITMVLQHQPGYTDAYYYLNAATRLTHGQGLTDAALWTYIGAPPALPAPAFLYWMPLASLLEAAGIAIGGWLLGSFHAAQLVALVCYVSLAIIGYRLGRQSGGTRRTGWLAGLLTIFSGFFLPYWTNTDTFAVYALIGALALVAMGDGRAALSARHRTEVQRSTNEVPSGLPSLSPEGTSLVTFHVPFGHQPNALASGSTLYVRWALAGALCGLAHLTRADGLLLLIVLIIVALWGRPKAGIAPALIGIAAYVLVMMPWAIHNLNTVGTVLPVGGFQTAWLRNYDQIAAYPPGASLTDFLAWGLGNIVQSRWTAFIVNLQTFVAVEGLIVLTPFMVLGAWRRRTDPRFGGFVLYAIGLHVLMTFVFAFPGLRGGLLHSAAALVPFWAALGAAGFDEALVWAAKRRRWPLRQAKAIFGTALIGYAIVFSLLIGTRQINGWNGADAFYRQIGATLTRDSIVMVNDPSAFYYETGLSAIVVPDSPPDVLATLVARYGVTTVILDENRPDSLADLYEAKTTLPFLRAEPPLAGQPTDVRIFSVIR